MNWENLQANIEEFSEKLILALDELGIKEACENLEIDHMCVRLKNASDVDKIKTQLHKEGKVISSVNVNGREISIVQLHKAIELGPWQTYGIELPYPKQNHNYIDGWEHVEFVFPTAENSMEGLRHTFKETFRNLAQEQLVHDYHYTEDEPHADSDQIPNPTIGIKVNGIGLKFHAHPIQTVVGYSR